MAILGKVTGNASDEQNAGASGSQPAAANSAASAGANSSFNSAVAAAGGGGSTGSNAVVPQSAADSAYELEEYVFQSGKTVVLGEEIGSLLGLSATAPVKIADIYQKISELNQAQATRLGQALNSAGLMTSDTGQPINLSNPNDPNFITSYLQALIAVSDQGPSANFSTYLANQQASGAGVQATQQTPQAQVGGGNTYQVALTNSADLQTALQSAYMQAMGVAPTQQQIQSFVDAFNNQESAYQQRTNANTEQAQVNSYNEHVTSAGVQAQSQQHLALGAVPNKVNSPAQYAIALLQYLNSNKSGNGTIPINASNVAAITGIINELGMWGNGSFNPLGSTYGVNGSQANPQSGTMTYQGWAQSIQATAEALSSPQYEDVMAALSQGKGTQGLSNTAVKAEINKFTNGALQNVNLSTAANAAHGAANHAINNSNGKGSGASGGVNAATGTTKGINAQGGSNTITPTNPEGPNKVSLLNGHYNAQGQWVDADDNTEANAHVNNADVGGGGLLSRVTNAVGGVPGQVTNAGQSNTGANTNANQQTAVTARANATSTTPPTATSPSANPTNPGNIYQGATEETNVQPPSAASAAQIAATTGANATPYAAYQALQAYNSILNLINNRGLTPSVQGVIGSS